jgi:hypothetical protein
LCFVWLAKDWSDISFWVYIELMNCLYKLIFGFGHG